MGFDPIRKLGLSEDGLAAEVWLPIPGYPHYEASSFGRVRSVDRVRTQKTRHGTLAVWRYKGLILEQVGPSPYLVVSPGRYKTLGVHVAVALAFHGERPSQGHIVAHWDDDKTNNVPSNLRWATSSENAQDDGRNNRCKRELSEIGNTERRLLESEIQEIRKAAKDKKWGIQTMLARKYKISQPHISRIISGEAWGHV